YTQILDSRLFAAFMPRVAVQLNHVNRAAAPALQSRSAPLWRDPASLTPTTGAADPRNFGYASNDVRTDRDRGSWSGGRPSRSYTTPQRLRGEAGCRRRRAMVALPAAAVVEEIPGRCLGPRSLAPAACSFLHGALGRNAPWSPGSGNLACYAPPAAGRWFGA